ncbi:MAG: YifB family Mg chelatase-like AAA ATPase [Actinobacteria bacterium]|nr:YifB family Mg chelatase-like AAA ATPase [Actinomycetota bacterium]
MIANVPSAILLGVDGSPVSVEVHASNGVPGFSIVGLPDAAVRESRDRVRAALLTSGFKWSSKRVTVNLAPSAVRKAGAALDLPIAMGMLIASEQIDPEAVTGCAFFGELGLDGSLRYFPGVIPLVDVVGTPKVVVPAVCLDEASVVPAKEVYGATSLRQVVDALNGGGGWVLPGSSSTPGQEHEDFPDLADVRGQPVGRRAVEVAAAGGHHLLLIGPPGSGKTMLATRLPGLLPPLTFDESLSVARIRSASALSQDGAYLPSRPPFRAPHHSATAVSIVGGGSTWLRPGEISLAHRGGLFMDELGEFDRAVLDSLREPLEEGVVRISRVRVSAVLPARFLLVAATNPCPCGEGMTPGSCRCTPRMRERYLARLSGPLLDRFDLSVSLAKPQVDDLLCMVPGESTERVASRVAAARDRAHERGVSCNAVIPSWALDQLAPMSPDALSLIERRLRSGVLSARGMDRIRRVALTIADLAQDGALIGAEHVAEALQLRAARSIVRTDER